MKRIFILLAGMVLYFHPAFSQSMSPLLISVDPASMGTAGVYAASGNTPYLLEKNAAAMSLSTSKVAAGVSYGIWAPDAIGDNIIAAGTHFRIGKRLAFGVSARYFMEESYNITSSNGNVTGSFTPSDMVLNLGASYKIGSRFSTGLAAKVYNSKIGEDLSGTAFGVDLSAAYKSGDFNAGLALRNLGTGISYGDGEKSSMPSSVHLTGGYEKYFAEVHGVRAGLEADYYFSGGLTAGLGASYSFKDFVTVRAGYHYGADDAPVPSFASLGVGAGFWKLRLNISWIPVSANSVMNNSLLFGLAFEL